MNLSANTLHHAYILEGDAEALRGELFEFLERELEHSTRGNPDFAHIRADVFSIDEARKLRDDQVIRPVAGARRIFVVETRSITVEAQNALLKTFEEPASHSLFFIITPSSENFLPTLVSRTQVISVWREVTKSEKSRAKEFLEMPIPKRLEYVSEIIENKDKPAAAALLDALISELGKAAAANASKLKDLLALRGYLEDRSPSLKLILEHIALIV